MDFAAVSILPILVCGVVFMFLGGLWYGPLFGGAWMALTGVTMDQAKAIPKNVMTRMYVGSYFAAVSASYIVALLVSATLTSTASGGAVIGCCVALGVVGGAYGSSYLFNQKPLKLYVIDLGYQVVCLTIAGAILGVWR